MIVVLSSQQPGVSLWNVLVWPLSCAGILAHFAPEKLDSFPCVCRVAISSISA